MDRVLTVSICALSLSLGGCQQRGAGDIVRSGEDVVTHLFAYFKGTGEDGLHLAYSTDGFTWRALNGDRPFLRPEVGEEGLMRDPSVIRGRDGLFHLFWTTGWWDRGIGYATSRDLVNWAEQRMIPVMENEPDARNAWAPEPFYDAQSDTYLIVWASTVPGKFPETDYVSERSGVLNHRLYFTRTSDFVTFTESELLYDPGHSVIDGSIARSGDRYALFFKDDTEDPPRKHIKVAFGDRAEGPYGPVSDPISGKDWSEGPTYARVGGQWIVYFDRYLARRFGAVMSRDLVTWTDVSDRLDFPAGVRHGTVFRVPEGVLEGLKRVGWAN